MNGRRVYKEEEEQGHMTGTSSASGRTWKEVNFCLLRDHISALSFTPSLSHLFYFILLILSIFF